MIKNPPAVCNAGDIRDEVRPLGGEDSLEKGMAAHSSIVAWRIPQRSLVGCSRGVAKGQTGLERLTHVHIYKYN